MTNYKCVSNGKVGLGTDILGVYGQCGTGKTSVIEAISILKSAMSGDSISSYYAGCVSDGSDFARLAFTFYLWYPTVDDLHKTVTYSFKIASLPYKVMIYDETITASGIFDGEMRKTQPILSAGSGFYPIGPVRKIHEFVGSAKDYARSKLDASMKTASCHSRSSLFAHETMDVFRRYSADSEYFRVVDALNSFAGESLFVIDKRHSNSFKTGFFENTRMNAQDFEDMSQYVFSVNTILPDIAQGIRIELEHYEYTNVCGERVFEVKLYSRRGGSRIPLQKESSGVIRLINVLPMITAAFNDRSAVVAVDDLDVGFHEYLLGDMLGAFADHGKGQLIFTSNNLRPLEILKKESALFTTSDPNDRYAHIKNIGQTNNVRSVYLRKSADIINCHL